MTNIQIKMEPNTSPMTLEAFVKYSEGYSIAIDGFCNEAPNEVQISEDGPRQIFDHHSKVYRPATLATCQQALIAVRTGFYSLFRDKQGRKLNIYANDADEDVCSTIFCFTNPDLVEGTINPNINRFYQVTGIMDATGGSYPYPPDLPYLEQHTWVFEPYLRFRQQGGLDKYRDPATFTLITEEVCDRIIKHILGKGGSIPLETDYNILYRGKGWALVKEIGTRARLRMFDEGIHAFISVAERHDNKLRATVGRFSGYTPFPVLKILEAFNKEEGLEETDDKAGGSDLIGGTSRKNGTKLSIEQIIKVTEGCL